MSTLPQTASPRRNPVDRHCIGAANACKGSEQRSGRPRDLGRKDAGQHSTSRRGGPEARGPSSRAAGQRAAQPTHPALPDRGPSKCGHRDRRDVASVVSTVKAQLGWTIGRVEKSSQRWGHGWVTVSLTATPFPGRRSGRFQHRASYPSLTLAALLKAGGFDSRVCHYATVSRTIRKIRPCRVMPTVSQVPRCHRPVGAELQLANDDTRRQRS